ncbi:mannose-1-phosphate guanylyltransferase/mannose-6-phosphate isomerase [Providencia rettgeri]|uniref:mannose-1-phosphate guanylyltransferase/mannose-6-phosphate isomerase n=1 Tax=Providencia rettgeri TaxID=587 RepID=UPI0039F5404A
MIPVIIAGGKGTRLWPLSRSLYPKQFHCLTSKYSMLQETLNRVDLTTDKDPIVICNEEHRFIVAEQLRQLGKLACNIILEPIGKNTAPAITLAALAIQQQNPQQDSLMLVLAADHSISDSNAFKSAVLKAKSYAMSGKLVTFGIVPSHPETGYGYIRSGNSLSSDLDAFHVAEFVEKPNEELAKQYILNGNYYWNSGMFLFRVDRYLEELQKFRPDILNACQKAMQGVSTDLNFTRIDKESFLACPEQSIDYAVMEHTLDAAVIPLDAGWSDVGSWSSLWDISGKDANGNVCQGDIICHNTKNSYIYSESGLVSTIGVNDLVIIQTKDALLVADRTSSQEVKDIVDILKNNQREELYIHREIYRPWGKYDSIDAGERYQVKRVTVKPGGSLSTHMHHHRSEYWIVVSGIAKVTINDDIKLLGENDSIYIPFGTTHTLENPGKISLDIIEIRSGSYLEDDDIIRY